MSLGDPFDSTYAGSFKAGQSLGEGIGSAAKSIGGKIEENNKRKQAYDFLQQFGMLDTKTEEPSLKELSDHAVKFAKDNGAGDLTINYGDNEEQSKKNLMGIYKALKIPMPQGKTKSTLNLSPGTKFDPIKGEVSMDAPADKSPLDSLIKMENLKYLQGVNKQMDGQGQDSSANLVYRDPVTGEQIDNTTAVQNMKEGKGRYVVNQKVITKAGVKENPVVKPEDLTKEEKDYVNTAERIKLSISDLKDNIYPRLEKLGGNSDWQSLQAQILPFAAIKNQDIQDFKSQLTRLKADIPFLRGGKALTPAEGKRVDILLNPFGKSKQTRDEDLERFEKEFMQGESLMKYGLAPSMGSGNIDLNNRPKINNPDGSYSTEKSFSFQDDDGKEVLIPTIVNGKELSKRDAIAYYKKTGENLGKFNSPEEADAAAEKIHNRFNKNEDPEYQNYLKAIGQ